MPSRFSFAKPALAAAAVLAMVLPGTSQAGFFGGVLQYAEDRADDLMDIFRLRVGIPRDGEAYGIKARATSLAQVGYVHFEGRYVGMERRALGVTDERRTEGGLSLAYGSQNEMYSHWGNSFLEETGSWSQAEDRRIIRNLPYWDDGRGHFLSVGTEIATPLISFDVGVYPEEAVDFVTGIFTLDPFNDDQLWVNSRQEYKPTTPPEPDLKAATRRKQKQLDEAAEAWKDEDTEANVEAGEAEDGEAAPKRPVVEEKMIKAPGAETGSLSGGKPTAKPKFDTDDLSPEVARRLREAQEPGVTRFHGPVHAPPAPPASPEKPAESKDEAPTKPANPPAEEAKP